MVKENQDYKDLFIKSPVASFILDREGIIVESNKKSAKILGAKTTSELSGKVFAQFVFNQDRPKLKLCRINLFENKNDTTCDLRIFKSTGEIIYARLEMSIVNINENDYIFLILTDITYHKHIENTQLFLLENSWADSGIDFFQALAEYLSIHLKMDYVCIERLRSDNEVETVAVYFDGHFEENVRYYLEGTPCGRVAKGQACAFPYGVRNLFPKATVLQNMGAESYVGLPLYATNGVTIGLIFVSSRKKLEDVNLAETILKQISIRAAAELEHRNSLAKLNRTFSAIEKSAKAMSRSVDEMELLNEVCQIISEDCGYKLIWIGYANQDKSIIPLASAGFEEGYLETLQLTWADEERGRGPSGTAIRTSQVVMSKNLLKDPNFAPWRTEAINRGYASSIAFPLISENKAFGVVAIYASEPDSFKEDEIKLLTTLVNDLSHGITSIRLRKELESKS